jgi:hypothetical protein
MSARISRFLLRVHQDIPFVRTFWGVKGLRRIALRIHWEAVLYIFTYRHRLGCRHRGFWICSRCLGRCCFCGFSRLLVSSINVFIIRRDQVSFFVSTITITGCRVDRIHRLVISSVGGPITIDGVFSVRGTTCLRLGGFWGVSHGGYRNLTWRSFARSDGFRIFSHIYRDFVGVGWFHLLLILVFRTMILHLYILYLFVALWFFVQVLEQFWYLFIE